MWSRAAALLRSARAPVAAVAIVSGGIASTCNFFPARARCDHVATAVAAFPMPPPASAVAASVRSIIALLLDSVLQNGIIALARPALALLDPLVAAIVRAVAPFAYDAYFSLWWRMQTPGEAALGVRAVNAKDHAALRWRQVLVRRLAHMAHLVPQTALGLADVHDAAHVQSFVYLQGVGIAVWPFIDRRHHFLHDTLAGTVCIATDEK